MQGLKQKKVNFIERLQADPKRDNASRRRMRMIIPLAALLLIILLVEGYIFIILRGGLQKEYDANMTYLNDPTVQANFDQVLSLNIELSTLQQDYQNSQSVFDNMDTFSELDRTLYDAVNNPAVAYSITVADYSFDRATGVLILNCSGPSSLSASTYMEALRTSNKFVAVSYIGYSGADNNYAFTATLQVIKGMEVSR